MVVHPDARPVVDDDGDTEPPALPPGYRLTLRYRGTTFLRSVEGPEDGPTVLLLHGWLATGSLNWFRCFGPLGQRASVIAPDLRGHGRGIRTSRRFTLRDCAEDVAVMLETLGTGPVIAVGYSMGGPVAQLLWRHHPDLVEGLVLVATGAEFVVGNRERYAFSASMAAVAGTSRFGGIMTSVPRWMLRRMRGVDLTTAPADGPTVAWARHEMGRHSTRMLAEAGLAISNYDAKEWLGEIDVPTSVVVTEGDMAVSPAAQFKMAMTIPGAHINRIPGGHIACVHPDFGRKLTDACLDVHHRIRGGWRPSPALDELDLSDPAR